MTGAFFYFFFFFFNDTATTEIYTLSLHDALPICDRLERELRLGAGDRAFAKRRIEAGLGDAPRLGRRSEEHKAELPSRLHIVCRLLLGKKKRKHTASWLLIDSTTPRTTTPASQ